MGFMVLALVMEVVLLAVALIVFSSGATLVFVCSGLTVTVVALCALWWWEHYVAIMIRDLRHNFHVEECDAFIAALRLAAKDENVTRAGADSDTGSVLCLVGENSDKIVIWQRADCMLVRVYTAGAEALAQKAVSTMEARDYWLPVEVLFIP
jgi:hypothetical protein